MRLIDHLAARRILYRRALPTLPDILLIDVPPAFAGKTLPLERYYPVLLETAAEAIEMDAFLQASRPTPVSPDIFDRRPSALLSQDVVFARYAPPGAGWPWLLLCCWPRAYTAMVPGDTDLFARGAYTIETFETLADLAVTQVQLLRNLGPHEARHVQQVDGYWGQA